jgi:signal transduction histidine kinase
MRRRGGIALVLQAQLVLIVFVPFALAVTLGGFVASSGVVLWSLLGPITAFLIGGRRGALLWLSIYLLLVVLLAALHPWLPAGNNLPTAVVLTFFALNIGAVSAITFGMIFYFVGENQRVHALLIRQQEEMRQTEKMSALGKLSAGLAHELNNPAAAARRAAEQLGVTLDHLNVLAVKLGAHGLSGAQWERLTSVQAAVAGHRVEPSDDPLAQADREAAIEQWLDSHGVADPWQLAPALSAAGLDPDALERIGDHVPAPALGDAVAWIGESLVGSELAGTTAESTARMADLVAAVKSYSYMDQAPEQEIDIHEGIENTITILGHKVKYGVTITREYDRTLPRLLIAGGELNQVWTNLLDNAIDAAGPEGDVCISTSREEDWLVVEIADNGPGIPADVQPRIFDPFFTTKDVGEGTGLGLDVARRIVTERCSGKIEFESQPGDTRFWVRLPLDP